MSGNIDHLREQLARARDRIEKIDLMIELASRTRRADPAGARKLATKALNMARATKDTVRMTRSTTTLGFCEYILANYSIALERFAQALALAEILGDATMIARAHYGLGITYAGLRNAPQAMESLAHARELGEVGMMRELLGHVHNGIAIVFSDLGDFPMALEHYQKAMETFKGLDDLEGESLALNNIGLVYKKLGDFEHALESFVRSNDLSVTNNDIVTQMSARLNLGDLLHRQGKSDEALQQYSHVLELVRTHGYTKLEASTLSAIGSIQIGKSDGDLDMAFSFCQQAVEIAERTGDSTLWQHIVRVGEVHHAREEYDRALEYYRKGLEGTRAQGDRFIEYQILSRLSQCHEDMGDTAEALRYHKLHTELKEEVVGRQQQQQLMQFRVRLEIERAERDRELLRLEKQRLEQEMSRKLTELTSTALHVVEKNEFLDSLKREISEVVRVVDGKVRPALRGLLRQVDAKINDAEDWDAFEKQFELVHHDFIRSLSRRCPTLTQTELKVCALVKLNLSNKEIASILSLSFRTIEVHRRNIRRKLDIPLETKLTTHLAGF